MGDVKEFYLTGENLTQSRLYELQMLAKEFFPSAEIARSTSELNLYFEGEFWKAEGKEESLAQPMPEKTAYEGMGGDPEKNRMKAGLYLLLRRWTGKDLPWGILTGVRPTKLAYSAMDAGMEPEKLEEHLKKYFFLREDKARLMIRVAQQERSLLSGHAGMDLDLYVGIPFCPTRCSYCSFVSYDFHTLGDTMERYTQALVQEIAACGSTGQETPKLLYGRRNAYIAGAWTAGPGACGSAADFWT